MLAMVEKGKIDTLVVWKMSRLARNSLDQAYIETYLQE
jgi:DNA invertase Pin-like site-specific DNA recombinase